MSVSEKLAAVSLHHRDTEKGAENTEKRKSTVFSVFSGPLCVSVVKKRRRHDSGFALLLVFLMAAIIAITLYMEIPRVAFATQRQKEQLLMERGEQYKMAIRRFCQANQNRWPSKIEDLENFNNR